jgi:hypothetical protein
VKEVRERWFLKKTKNLLDSFVFVVDYYEEIK